MPYLYLIIEISNEYVLYFNEEIYYKTELFNISLASNITEDS